MSVTVLSIVVMLAAGVMVGLQGPINAALGRGMGSPVNAALVSFLVGTVALTIVSLVQRVHPDPAALRALPWWAWVGGLCGAVFVSGAAYAVPRIGAASVLTIAIGSQLVTAVALDAAGLLGSPARSVTWTRFAGVLLVLGGAVLVRRA